MTQNHKLSEEELAALMKAAGPVIRAKTAALAQQAGVSYGRITIRHQRSRWGSCSSKGNLNFNCLLMLAPETVRNSVICHELCHLKQMNHSAAFYEALYRLDPDYEASRRWLKANGAALIACLPDSVTTKKRRKPRRLWFRLW